MHRIIQREAVPSESWGRGIEVEQQAGQLIGQIRKQRMPSGCKFFYRTRRTILAEYIQTFMDHLLAFANDDRHLHFRSLAISRRPKLTIRQNLNEKESNDDFL